MMQRIRQRIRKRPWMVPALLLVLVFAMGLLVEAIRPLGGSATTVGPKWVDDKTNTKYTELLGSTDSTQYSGRVWADKTVYDHDVDLGLSGEVDDIIQRGDDDFLIGYSLLAATTVVSGQSVVPLDVVFVIDLSLSMEEDEKIEQTVVALNEAVKTLMNGHPDTRIGVVTYSTEAEVLLPLDHYSKVESEDYFSLTVVEGTKALRAHVLDSQGKDFEKASKMSTWTNIHMGIDTGMDLLLNADVETPSRVERYPAMMLMSDGAPTCAGDNKSDWWDPQGVENSYFGPDTTGTYTLRTVMNAAYQKQQVSRHYGMEMEVYTVGVGVESLDSETDRAMAAVTLNPETGLNLEYAYDVKTTWEKYLANNPSELPELGGYRFNHPAKENDISSLYYNDGYFSAKDANGISGAFNQVLDKIIVTGAVPTEVGEDPQNSGYITYTDPIGKYMEVKDVKALAWDNTIYRFKTVNREENVTTYVFSGNMTSPVYGTQRLSEITISVTTDEVTKDQTLVVKVPAAVIPLRVNTVSLNDDGTVYSNECKNDKPLRLFYTVGVRNDVLTAEKEVDLTKIDSEYIAKHTTKCGDVLFYSNLYTGDAEDQAGVTKTVGNATVNFVPAANNPFYFNRSKTLLYADEECNTPAKYGVSTVYVKVPYYSGTEKTYGAVKRPYDEAWMTPGTDGYLYLNDGAPCYLGGLIIDKGAGNVTKTAETYHYPIYVDPESGTTYSSETSKTTRGIQLHLGNNGALKGKIATGDLTISKTVTGNMGEKCREFTFYITMYHGGTPVKLDGSYEATLTSAPSSCPEPSAEPSVEIDPSSTPSIGSGEVNVQFIHGKAEIKLKHGQSITIHDLPTGYVYTVWEDNPDTEERDYTVTATQNGQQIESWNEKELACTGTIQNKQNDQLAYTNKCYVPMVDFSFIKVDGLSFDSTDLDSVITLSGAEFTLYRYTGKSWETDKDILMNPASEYAVWSQVGDLEISDENGVVTFDDLRAGNYRLVEVSAPDGYQLPKGQWNLTVSISGAEGSEVGDFAVEAIGNSAMDAPAMAKVEDNQGNVTYYLMNYKPINPPVTGGDGGEDFRIGGSLLMFTGLVLACWWMWSSPRRRSEFL